MTRDAIFAFQSIFGLLITGVVNEATWNRLMQEAANGRTEPEVAAMPMKAMPVESIMPMSDMMPMGNLGPAMMHGAEAVPGNMSGVISGFNAMPVDGAVPRFNAVPVKDDIRPIGYVGLNDGMKLSDGVVLRGDPRPMEYHERHMDIPMGHEMKHDGMRPMGHDAKKDKEVMSGSVLTHPYGYVPYGADYRRMNPREMRYYDSGPDRRGYGYGYCERNL